MNNEYIPENNFVVFKQLRDGNDIDDDEYNDDDFNDLTKLEDFVNIINNIKNK